MTAWMNTQGIVLGELNQSEKDTHCVTYMHSLKIQKHIGGDVWNWWEQVQTVKRHQLLAIK